MALVVSFALAPLSASGLIGEKYKKDCKSAKTLGDLENLGFNKLAIDKLAKGPRFHNRSLSPWVERCNGQFIYKFNVFNLAESQMDQKTVKSMLDANLKDICLTYGRDYGAVADVRLYTADQINNHALFEGDRIPFFIVYDDINFFGGFHAVESAGPANVASFLFANNSIQDQLGLTVPSNFPDWTPYGAVNIAAWQFAAEAFIASDNIYALWDWQQLLSTSLNHELKEILGDDCIQNWVLFDTFAPTLETWHYGEFDSNGVCTNGVLGPDGYVHLPLFLEVFPYGGLFTTIQENADVVSRASASKLNGYLVDGWYMSNYPTSAFWKGYYEGSELKYDYLGNVQAPLQPYGGLHEIVLFLDYMTGLTSYGEVDNYGPVTYSQRYAPPQNNFPPNYTVVQFYFAF